MTAEQKPPKVKIEKELSSGNFSIESLRDNVDNVITNLQALKEEFKDDYPVIELNIEAEDSWGYGPMLKLEITGIREETESEYKNRLLADAIAKSRQEEAEKFAAQQQYKLYLKLKSIYEKTE